MLGSFSVLNMRVHDFKGKIWDKVDKSYFEEQIGAVIDSLNCTDESPLQSALHDALNSSAKTNRFCITNEGDVYLEKDRKEKRV